jgi:hypothetical protein
MSLSSKLYMLTRDFHWEHKLALVDIRLSSYICQLAHAALPLKKS